MGRPGLSLDATFLAVVYGIYIVKAYRLKGPHIFQGSYYAVSLYDKIKGHTHSRPTSSKGVIGLEYLMHVLESAGGRIVQSLATLYVYNR